MSLLKGLGRFLRDFGSDDTDAPAPERWLRAVAHAFLGEQTGVGLAAAPHLLWWALGAWAVVQGVQWGARGWTKRGGRDVLQDTLWTLGGVALGHASAGAAHTPELWAAAAAAMLIALVAYGAYLSRPR